MMKGLLKFSVFVLFIACNNLDSVSPASRNSFVHYFGGTGNYQAVSALELKDGFLLIGDSISASKYAIITIRTDQNGKTIWRKKIDNAVAASALSTNDGYLIIGDSMNVDLTQTTVADQIKRKMRIISMSATGSITTDKSWYDKTDDQTDFRGSSLTLDESGKIISTSTVKPRGVPAYVLVAQHDPSSLAINWFQKYNQDNRDYHNSKSVYINSSGNIIWATSAVVSTTVSSQSFVRIPVMAPNSTFVNSGLYGQDTSNVSFSGDDICPNGVGFGIVGTYQTYTGENSNIFFLRTDNLGNPILNSVLYLDGFTVLKTGKPLSDKNESSVQDTGNAIASTSDGGFLIAGSTTTTTDGSWGNGGTDVFLIRLNAFGQILWFKTFGGTGDEVPSTVRLTADGGFVISGTLTLAGQSSMFLLKVDANGELKN
jgi:hypothetical protein